MKQFPAVILTLLGWFLASAAWTQEGPRPNLVVLDETAVENLQIKTVVAEERPFEQTVFAIGRIEEIPENRAVLSSRVAGRVVEINAFIGDQVKKGDVVARIESRQPGDPPPVIPLVAPRDGVVLQSHIRLGEPVEPDEELMDVADYSEVWAVAQIPEQEAEGIEVGSPARIHVHALGDGRITADLARFGVTADREAGTVEGIFRIENTEGKLRPGMRAEFSIIADRRENVLAVPREAVQGSAIDRFVFIKDFELPNAFIKSPVVLGEENDQFVEIKSGVFPLDEVVTRGSYPLAFAQAGSGQSLKEALDAAHGHEHNEDGSPVTEEQQAAREAEEGPAGAEPGMLAGFTLPLLVYSGVVTLIAIVLGQAAWKRRRG